MRTDSVHLSQEALKQAGAYIHQTYGNKYHQLRNYKTKNKGAQEAHEAIRPTSFSTQTIQGDANMQRLYTLIHRQALASQMANATVEINTIEVLAPQEQRLVAKAETITFDGFLVLYPKETKEQTLLAVAKGDPLAVVIIEAKESFSKPPAYYSEATLVRELEQRGIGRPSTYAPTIEVIQKREYAVKESRDGTLRPYNVLTLQDGAVTQATKKELTGAQKNKLFPTETGIVVNDFLQRYFDEIVDYSFTAEIEDELDAIAQGKQEWQEMLTRFYKEFHEYVEKGGEIDRKDISNTRTLGTDPKTGKTVYAMLGKFGPYVQLGEKEDNDDKPPARASIPKEILMEQIELKEALKLLAQKRVLGEDPDSKRAIHLLRGPYGPYVQLGESADKEPPPVRSSLPKDTDLESVTLNQALELIKEALEKKAKQEIKTFEENPEVKVLEGRYGPYVRFGKKNIRIPKETEPKDITYAMCVELNAQPVKKRGFRKKKK